VKKVRTKPKKSAKSIKELGKTMWENTQNKWKKAWDCISNQFQSFLTFCRVRGEKCENKAKKIAHNPSKIEEKQ